METLLLAQDDIRDLVRAVGLDALMDLMIARLTEAFATFDPEHLIIPKRNGFSYRCPVMGLVEWMPCYETGKQVTIKVVGYHPTNAEAHNLPTIVSTMSAYDTASGHLQCVMDGNLATALRTGAASAVATRLLASDRAQTVGLVGAGAQAVTQIHALARVLDVKEVFFFDTNPAVQATFPARVAPLLGDIALRPASLEAVVQSADVLCTATSVPVGEGPVFDDIATRSWVHINAIGSDFPGKTEIPPALLQRSFVCPDFREQAVAEGECQQLCAEAIGPDLYEVVQDAARYAPLQERPTIFDSTGWALEDHVALMLFMDLAAEHNIGKKVRLEHLPADPHNPYQFGDG